MGYDFKWRRRTLDKNCEGGEQMVGKQKHQMWKDKICFSVKERKKKKSDEIRHFRFQFGCGFKLEKQLVKKFSSDQI